MSFFIGACFLLLFISLMVYKPYWFLIAFVLLALLSFWGSMAAVFYKVSIWIGDFVLGYY